MTASKPRTTTAIRFPPELHEALRVAAEERDLSINYLVIRAVQDFLPHLIPADELRLIWCIARRGSRGRNRRALCAGARRKRAAGYCELEEAA